MLDSDGLLRQSSDPLYYGARGVILQRHDFIATAENSARRKTRTRRRFRMNSKRSTSNKRIVNKKVSAMPPFDPSQKEIRTRS
ncbi:hypothetical protein KCP78_11400 [Salmonella enterica subsp. enterica]|nr:hypothetical protein KCP78_11400 [Salmonella enterica subsp. enterica]